MNYNMYIILAILGMVSFLLSFFIKDMEDKVLMSTLSLFLAFIAAAASCAVTTITYSDTIVTISEPWVHGFAFLLLATVQIIRLYFWHING